MYDSPIPFFELSQVRRQSVQSPVHRFAMAVRKGEVLIPEMALKTLPESPDCCVLPPSLDRLTHFWEDAGALSDRIILSPRRSGDWGVTSLNTHFQKILGSERDDLHYLDPVKGWIPWITRFKQRLKLGDPVLVTRNIYDDELDVRNGDLGSRAAGSVGFGVCHFHSQSTGLSVAHGILCCYQRGSTNA